MDLRALILARIERLYPGDTYRSGMMQALMIGQSFQLERVWTQYYRETGTFHALVISGTHVAILAAFFLFFLRVCFVPESVALLLTVVAAWFYALLTGWLAPCTRAASGLTLVLIAGYFYRERRPLNLLAAVALGFLVFDPEQMFDASFQLTFLAVAFLGAFATPLIRATSGPLARGLQDLGDTGRDIHLPPRIAQFRIEMRQLAETVSRVAHLPARAGTLAVAVTGRLLLFFYEITVISAVIQAGLALPMVVYFHRVGLSGLSANAFVVPLMGLAVPLGFVAVFTGWVWVAKIAGVLLWLSQKVVYWHAGIEPALAHSHAAGVAGRGLLGRPDCRRPGARPLVAHRDGAGGRRVPGAAALASLPARRPSRRTGDDGHRRGPGRQHFCRLPRWKTHARRWRRHSRLRPTDQVAARYRRRRGGALPVGPRHPQSGRGGALARP